MKRYSLFTIICQILEIPAIYWAYPIPGAFLALCFNFLLLAHLYCQVRPAPPSFFLTFLSPHAPRSGGAPAGRLSRPALPGQVEEHVSRIREELDREREERNYFQLERDKIHTFWEITRRQLEEKKAELRNKDREMEEAEERHQVEIKVSGPAPAPLESPHRSTGAGWGRFLFLFWGGHSPVYVLYNGTLGVFS